MADKAKKKDKGPEEAPARILEDNALIRQRRKKAADIKEMGVPLFPNTFRPRDRISDIITRYGRMDGNQLESYEDNKLRIAGRIMALRSFGKAAFIKIQDRSGAIQVHMQRDVLGQDKYKIFKKLEVGDIIGVVGPLFRTRTQELTVRAEQFVLITKSHRPLPEKFHGLTDVEARYRQRYLDLIMNESTREIFQARAKIVKTIRNKLEERGFIEVETPMMQIIPGGATSGSMAL